MEVLKDLVAAGVYYGHQTWKWHPKIKPFILDVKEKIHIIDLEQTFEQITKAGNYLADLVTSNKQILFIGCKRQAQDAIKKAAESCSQHYVNHRWLGGTLTNLSTIRNSVKRLEYLEQIEMSPEFKKMSKKELASLNRQRQKLTRSLQGVRNLRILPSAMIIVDIVREKIALAEAKKLNIPVVGILDTNTDPSLVDFPIVANDDSIRSISKVMELLSSPILNAMGKMSAQERAEAELLKS